MTEPKDRRSSVDLAEALDMVDHARYWGGTLTDEALVVLADHIDALTARCDGADSDTFELAEKVDALTAERDIAVDLLKVVQNEREKAEAERDALRAQMSDTRGRVLIEAAELIRYWWVEHDPTDNEDARLKTMAMRLRNAVTQPDNSPSPVEDGG